MSKDKGRKEVKKPKKVLLQSAIGFKDPVEFHAWEDKVARGEIKIKLPK